MTAGSRFVAARLVAPLVLAAALAGAAVATVERAGCETPGRYEVGTQGVAYVSGCLLPGELPHGDPDGDRAAGAYARRG